jgi:hemoglobin
MRARILGAVLLAAAVGTTALRADDKPIERADLDKRIVNVVYQAALQGTEIFNKGNYEGCYRLYQGTLMALYPLLDHRPKLQEAVGGKLAKAKILKPTEGAFVLREALDEIQNEIAPSAKKATLWSRLGGEEKVKKVVDDFMAIVLEDKKANFLRDGKVKLDEKAMKHLKQVFVEMISVNTGGQLKYTGDPDMKKVHAGMKITDAEFDATLADMDAALKKNGVADADAKELIDILASARKDIVAPKN